MHCKVRYQVYTSYLPFHQLIVGSSLSLNIGRLGDLGVDGGGGWYHLSHGRWQERDEGVC